MGYRNYITCAEIAKVVISAKNNSIRYIFYLTSEYYGHYNLHLKYDQATCCKF